MKIPKIVRIAGINFDVKFKEFLSSGENSVTYGESCFNEKEILIAENKELYKRHYRSSHSISYEEQIKVFFHELWHMICVSLNSDDVNTEKNSEVFGVLCGNVIFEKHSSEPDISRDNYRKLMSDVVSEMRCSKMFTEKEANIINLGINCISFSWAEII